MKLEDQCVSLECAKRLKELGVKQESLMKFIDNKNELQLIFIPLVKPKFLSKIDNCIIYSAFTSSELLELLPSRITTNMYEPYNSFTLQIRKSFTVKDVKEPINIQATGVYSINYICDTASEETGWAFITLVKSMIDENFSNACAKMLIFLIENGYVKNE